MGEGIEKNRNLSFWYINENHTPDYKKLVKDYLKEKEEEIIKIGIFQLIIDLHGLNLRENREPTGHIYINNLENKENKIEEVCKYILSKDRRIKPIAVKCRDKEDYSMIEKILEENYGEVAKLRNFFWIYGRKLKIKSPRTEYQKT